MSMTTDMTVGEFSSPSEPVTGLFVRTYTFLSGGSSVPFLAQSSLCQILAHGFPGTFSGWPIVQKGRGIITGGRRFYRHKRELRGKYPSQQVL